MENRGEVLVAIMNKPLDFAILREKLWYRIPVRSVEKWLEDKWPPQWIAFYQTKEFKQDAYAINYFGKILEIRKVFRWQLFPDEPRDAKSQSQYYQIYFSSLERLPKPIISQRWRRIIFIPTTWQKFVTATQINDLYDESRLEDRLWEEFKRWQIMAERQEYISANKRNYFLDFAIYCAMGKVDVETDGDFWHANPERAADDNLRDNDLKTSGWQVLRFSTLQIQEQMADYCLPTVVKSINNYGGIDEGKTVPRKIDLSIPPESYQPSLFG